MSLYIELVNTLGGNMLKKDQLPPEEFRDYIKKVQNMSTHEFAEEFMEAEDIVKSYICAVDSGSAALPSKEGLARAVLCLICVIPDPERPKTVRNLIHSLSLPANGVALYAIKPQVNEIFLLAQSNLERIKQDNEAPRSSHDYDDLF